MQVKALEEQAGLPLFEQIGKKIFLTEAGKELHVRCRAVSDELRAAEEALKAMRGIEQGKLTVGIVSTGKYFVPQLLGRFLQAHPGVTFKLSVNNREVVLRELAENELDLAIVREWHVAHLAGKRLSPAAQALKQFLLEEAWQYLPGQDARRAASRCTRVARRRTIIGALPSLRRKRPDRSHGWRKSRSSASASWAFPWQGTYRARVTT